MITIQSDPSHVVQVSPEIVSRYLATESPNNFRLLRTDFIVTGSASSGGSPETLELELSTEFTGGIGDVIAVYNATNGAMYTGSVTAISSPATTITTDIPWIAGMNISYLNDNTLKSGYYFEGKLTVNDVEQPLTVIATPDTFGVADLDISGILRIMVSLGKTADYSALIAAEPTKSGKFTFAYRECWYGEEGTYTEEGNTWYYVEAVRSVEQGSNLYEYMASEVQDAPFLNLFANPVYFEGLPFDLSFILPVLPVTSPPTELTVTINRYNAANTLLSTTSEQVAITDLEGKVNSLNIDPESIEEEAAYMTCEITTP
jgi:hypothetical protein